MKTFLRIVGVVVTLFVAVTLFGFLLPREIRIERSILVEAPPEQVYPLVADLKRWPDWQAWNKEMDPTVEYTFAEPSAGEGAWYEWKGEKLSTGKVALTGVEPDRAVDYTVDFGGSGANPGTMTFQEVPKVGHAHVVWSFDCDMGFSPVGRYMGLMMKGMLDKDFDTGLANLKRLAESEAEATPPVSAQPTSAQPTSEEQSTAEPGAAEAGADPNDDASATDPVPADAGADAATAPESVPSDATDGVTETQDGASKEAPIDPID